MFKGSGHAGGKTAIAAGAGAAAVLALGVWLGSQRELPEVTPQGAQPHGRTGSGTAMLAPDAVQGASVGPEGTAATEPEAATPETTAPEASAPEAAKAQSAEATPPPAFDEVRRDPDGMTVIAGRAAPGSTVTVLKDGKEVASATADGAGKFATLAMIPPDGEGHVLTLMEQDGEAQSVSAEEIILAPIAAPQDTAAADTVAAEPSAPAAEAPAEEDIAIAALSDAPAASPAATPRPEDATTPPASETAQPAEPVSTDPTVTTETLVEEGQRISPAAPEVEAETDRKGNAQTDPAATDQTNAPASTAMAETDTVPETPSESAQGTDDGAALAATGGPEPVPAPSDAEPSRQDAPAVETGATTRRAKADPAPTDEAQTSTAETATTQTVPQTPEAVSAAPEKPGPDAPAGASPEVTAPQGRAEVAPTAAPSTPSAPAVDPTAAPSKPLAPATATAPVAVLKSTAEGVERIDTAPPQVMTNVALDTIGYSDQGDVQLAGRAQPETREVRVYLNNDAIITLPVDAQGRWRGDLPDVDEGIYTLRVDELSARGDVTSRVETPFKRESPQALAQASAGLSGPLGVVTVQKGDTLWAISRERYGDPFLYVKVFEANSDNIRDPDLIYPGQVFDLPVTTPAE